VHQKESDSVVVAALGEVFLGAALRTDSASLSYYGSDWTQLHAADPLAVVFPCSTEQVQRLVLLANEFDLALVPSGGRTGLSGGAVAHADEVVVCFENMNSLRDFNAVDRTVVCEAGVITQQLQAFAVAQGFYYPVDFASSGSSQIGGNIATNAGGIKVIRYGLTRDWVVGLTVVTGKGDVLELNKGLLKNATGYDLRHLFIGSEGTLGFITEATIRLAQAPRNLTVMVLAVASFDALMPVLQRFQQATTLTAFEFFSDRALGYVLAAGDVRRPMAIHAPCYALLEYEALSDGVEKAVMQAFDEGVEEGLIMDGVASQNEQQARDLWHLREGISPALAACTPYKNDLSVVVSKVPEFLARIEEVVTQRYPDFDIIWYGHIGDGNLHLNILKPETMDKATFFSTCGQVSEDIFEVVAQLGGSVSAEHGVGLLKKEALSYSRSVEELAYFRAMKQAFDPQGIMNPGKMFD
jgi:FAD/FMN-containing dehydrogenase